MNKKILRGLSVTAIAFSLFACGGNTSSSSQQAQSSSASSASEAPVEKKLVIDVTKAQTKDAGDKIIETKKELLERYGMSAINAPQGEWYVQTANFEKYVQGKTIDEVVAKAADYKTNYNKEGTEVITGCSISVDNFINSLKTITDTKTFTASEAPVVGVGNIISELGEDNVLTVTMAGVATVKDSDKVLSSSINCYQIPLKLNAAQDGAELDTTKTQTKAENLTSHGAGVSSVLSKRELKELYNMENSANEGEWFTQADNFAAYTVGQNAAGLGSKNYKTHYNTEGTEVVTGCSISCSDFGKAVEEGAVTLKAANSPEAAADASYTLKFGSYVAVSNETQIEVSTAAVLLNSENKIVSSYFDVLQAPIAVK